MPRCPEPTPTELLNMCIADPPKTDYERGFLAAVLMIDGGSHPKTYDLLKMLAITTGK